jgi:molecular chaperone GrpE (heat shock protein)
MNDDLAQETPRPAPAGRDFDAMTQGMSSLYKLFEAFIALREKNERQHRLFEQALTRARDTLQDGFNGFAGATQKAYQQLRQELHGEKRAALALLNEMLELGLDLERIVAARPDFAALGKAGEPFARWAESVEVQCRKVQAALRRHGIHPYDAVVGSAYNPALHERVGGKRMEGMDAWRVAEQVEHGYASQQPDFVLKRPKVLVTE